MNKLLRSVSLILVTAFCSSAQADIATTPETSSVSFGFSLGIDPMADWKTIESERFKVTYPAELEMMASQATNYLEQAHVALNQMMRWEPKTKTQVILVDNADVANGLATASQRFGIVLYLTPPDDLLSPTFYSNWLKSLCFHEYLHYLNIDPATEWVRWLSWFFGGDALKPNALWPRWMLEGLAVYIETRYDRGGRGNSPYYEMVLRSAVKENALDDPDYVTLDRVNGSNPYHPGGETPYLFGYQLMNQIANDKSIAKRKTTFDGHDPVKDGEDALGLMSYRSSARIPYFIDDNLKNITGKKWKDYWKEWLADTRKRMKEQLNQIRSEHVTTFAPLTKNGYEALGAAVSPDGKWIAYTQDSNHHPPSLILRDLKTGKEKRIARKWRDSTLSFTADSKTIIFSGLKRSSQYNIFADLAVYSIEDDRMEWLTDGLRMRDPHLSPDGKKIVFTLSRPGAISLAQAEFKNVDGKYQVGEPQVLVKAAVYDKISTPRYSPDGKKIVYAIHRNNKYQQDIELYRLASKKTQRLVSNGAFNRFPTYDPSGNLYFVSNKTGVDNVYRYRSGGNRQITNTETGIWLPAFGPKKNPKKFYASVFSIHGWDLAEVHMEPKRINSSRVKVKKAPAPKYRHTKTPNKKYTGENYFGLPSLIPRQWSIFIFPGYASPVISGQIFGYDALFEHQYTLSAGAELQVKKLDWTVEYVNRSFHPIFTVGGGESTSAGDIADDGTFSFTRKALAVAAVTFPLRKTWSAFTPSIIAQSERDVVYVSGVDTPVSKSEYVPSLSVQGTYDSRLSSALAVTSEEGGMLTGGLRLYGTSTAPTWKGLLTGTYYFRLHQHIILVPSAGVTWTSRRNSFANANTLLAGRSLTSTQSSADSDKYTLDNMRIRGYPGITVASNFATTAALDLRFPLQRVFRGVGTDPYFFKNLWGFVFGEVTAIPTSSSTTALPGVGGGVKLSSQLLLNIPVTFSAQYHYGFNKDVAGTGEYFFLIEIGS